MGGFATPVFFAIMVSLATVTPAQAASPFHDRWIDAAHGPEPETQVQSLDPDSFVIRQSIATNPEGPFLYLLFGTDRAILFDTGAGGLEIKPTIDKIVAGWLKAHGKSSIPLVVAHSHAHGDHIAGDPEFAGQPGVTVVGHAPADVAKFFDIRNWPGDIVPYDLGGRIIDVIPTPGHEAAALMIFDRRTRVLLTDDTLYPGRLYCQLDQFDAFRKSIDRAVAFTKPLHVSWLLGAHIEMTTTPKRDYAIDTAHHPNEHALELSYARLLRLQADLHKMGDKPRLDVESDFIFYPLP
jgi:glyoxylase-like metal-dependent hydrolase (beta-lactamase superfamily II)